MERTDWGQRIGTVAVNLAIFGVFWWFYRLAWPLTALIVGFILVSGLLPPLIGRFVGALGFLVVAGVIYKWYMIRGWHLPAAIAALGLIYLAVAVTEFMRARRMSRPDVAP